MVVTLGKSGGKAVVSRIRLASSRLAVMLISTMAVLTTLNSTDGIVAKVALNVAFSPSSFTVGCPDMMDGTVNEDNNTGR